VQDHLWEATVLRLERGEGWRELEGKLVQAVSGLSEDERAALWLAAWSYQPGGERAAQRVRELVGR
jgi:hypothetical protein